MPETYVCNRPKLKVVAVPPVPMVGTGNSARPLTNIPEVSVQFVGAKCTPPTVEELVPRFEAAYLEAGEDVHEAKKKAKLAAKAAHDRLMRLLNSDKLRQLAGVRPEGELLESRAKAAAEMLQKVAQDQGKSVDELLKQLPPASDEGTNE